MEYPVFFMHVAVAPSGRLIAVDSQGRIWTTYNISDPSWSLVPPPRIPHQ